MAEYTNTSSQTVASGNNVVFTASNGCGCSVNHTDGSGLFTLHGGRRYLVTFNANVSGGTADTEVALAMAINGEMLRHTIMRSTPGSANALNNVSASAVISVPNCCCYQLSVKNVDAPAVTVSEANLIIKREA